MSIRVINLVLSVFVVVVFMGCAKIPNATLQEIARSKEFSARPGKALIYIAHSPAFIKLNGSSIIMGQDLNGARAFPINVNGENVGNVGIRQYVVVEVDPGLLTISSQFGFTPTGIFKTKVVGDSEYYINAYLKDRGYAVTFEFEYGKKEDFMDNYFLTAECNKCKK